MIAVALKGLAARKLRALLTALAVVIGVSMVAGTFILTDTTWKAGLALDDATTATTDAAIFEKEVVKGSTGAEVTIPASFLDEVRALPGVATAVGDVMPQKDPNVADIIGRDGSPAATSGLARGVDPSTMRVSPVNAGVYGPLKLESGAWAKGTGQVVIDRRTAASQHFRLGDRVTVVTQGTRHTFELTGTVSYLAEDLPPRPSLAVWDVESAQALLDRSGHYDVISIEAAEGTSGSEISQAVRPLLPANLQVKDTATSVADAEADGRESLRHIRVFLLAFGGIALLVGAFVIFNALSITVAQRTRELATLRTLGASRKQVLRSVLVEGIVLGLVASVIGLAFGYGVAKGMLVLFDALGVELPDGTAVVATRTVVVSLLVGTVITLLASMVPARRATRVPPIAAVREGATLPPTRLGGLVGAARFVEPLVRVLGWPARRAGVAGELALANAVRNPGRTASTAATLMIGLTLVTVVAVLGASVNTATEKAISDQIDAAYVIDGKDQHPFRAEVGDELAALPGVRTASNVRSESVILQGKERAVSGIDPATIGHFYRFTWSAGSERTLAGLDGNEAIVTKAYAEDHDLAVGRSLSVKAPSGERSTLVVSGIYTPPQTDALLGDVSISQETFDAAFRRPRNSFTFLDAEPAAGPAIAATVRRFGDAVYHTGAAYPHDATKDMHTFVAMLYVLLGFSVIVSLFGMVNTMILAVFERTREIGLLRTIGMTRRQARQMIRHESIVTALIGAALGIALGLFLSVVIAVATPNASGITIPFVPIAAFTAVAALAGVIAAILPARRASRLNVLEALQYE